ncbi:MAG: hypothetical protein II663_01695 [Bacteroidales bacterium]|nr:hypothetical protein [Bacteroidales bacterium]
MEVLNICLSDIDKSKIFTAKNGKKYLSVVVTERKEVDQYGNDLVVYVSQSKDERDNKAQKNYIGNGKTYGEKSTTAQQQEAPQPQPQDEETDDLPF